MADGATFDPELPAIRLAREAFEQATGMPIQWATGQNRPNPYPAM